MLPPKHRKSLERRHRCPTPESVVVAVAVAAAAAVAAVRGLLSW